MGGSQLWSTDGTVTGTVRAFNKNGNDIYIDRAGTDLNYPPKFGIFGYSVYLSGNINYENIPIGGFRVQNKLELIYGFDQAVAVYDSDTPPLGVINVTLHVDKGVVVLSDSVYEMDSTDYSIENNVIVGSSSSSSSSSSNNNDNKEKLSFLLALPQTYKQEQSLLFNSLIALGHSVTSVYSGDEIYNALGVNTNILPGTKSNGQTDKIDKFDILLLSLVLSTEEGGLQVTRNVRLYESLLLNSTAIPIYIFAQVNFLFLFLFSFLFSFLSSFLLPSLFLFLLFPIF